MSDVAGTGGGAGADLETWGEPDAEDTDIQTEDVTDFQRNTAGTNPADSGQKQARITKSLPNRDPIADGENKWFRGQLVRRWWR